MSGRRWIIRAFSVFCLLLVVWVVAAMVLNAAAEGSLPVSMHVYSDLYADYSPDVVVRPLGVFNLSIISETLKDRGYSEEEAQERVKAIEVAMNEPVPTATALNYEGDAPYTATPTKTYTPTPTSTPTLTPTNTPTKIPTKTPTKTPTPKPTKKPKPSKTPTEEVICPEPCPTDTPIPETDTKSPIVSGGVTYPPFGEYGSCTLEITVDDLHIVDPAYSSGIAWVKLKVKYFDGGEAVWKVSGAFEPDDPIGWTEGPAWDAYVDGLSISKTFDGAAAVSLYDGSVKGAKAGYAMILPFTCDTSVELYAWVMDNGGNDTKTLLGTYTLPEGCFEGD
jgi:hypothetical protein